MTTKVRHLRIEAGARGRGRSGLSILRCLASEVGLRAITLHRFAEAAELRRAWILASAIRQTNLTLHGIDIERGARIGYFVQIPHTVGVVIGSGAVIEDGVQIFGRVTLGRHHSPERMDGYPHVHADALLGVGAAVLGPIEIGRGAMVGANAVVTSPVAEHSVVAGNPARFIDMVRLERRRKDSRAVLRDEA